MKYMQESFLDKNGNAKEEDKVQCDSCKKWRRMGDFAFIGFWPKMAKTTTICKNCYKKA